MADNRGKAGRVVTTHRARRAALAGGTWPERRVVRTGISPMNPKVKWAELDCGHDVYRLRKPRIGAVIVCELCARQAEEAALRR